jgi:tetratricopeptide (TPR) repeat protein
MGSFQLTSDHSSGASTATCLFAAIALLAPLLAPGQCQPLVDSGTSRGAEPAPAASAHPEFFDEPQFTVAGVTDPTNLGGHGSDTVLRTKEALAQATVALSRESPTTPEPASSSISAAEKSLREAAAHEPGNFQPNHELGKFLVEHGKGRESLPYLERASRLNPGDYENNHQLVLAYLDLGRYEEADKKIIELLARPEPDKSKADLHRLLGDIEEKKGHPLEAVRQYQQSVEVDPSEPNIFDWAAELLMHGAPEPAIEVLSEGHLRFPDSVRILTALGVAWYIRGSYDQAAQRLCQASDLAPDDPNPYLFLGKMQAVEATPSQEITARLERFARLQPENAMADYYYAVSLWKQRKDPQDRQSLARIEALLNKAVHLDPKLSEGFLQLGILYSETKDLPRAIAAYQYAIEISPRMAEAHYRLAQAYRRAGEVSKAEEQLQLYKRISKERQEQADRERRDLQRFVYTLRSQSPPSQSR